MASIGSNTQCTDCHTSLIGPKQQLSFNQLKQFEFVPFVLSNSSSTSNRSNKVLCNVDPSTVKFVDCCDMFGASQSSSPTSHSLSQTVKQYSPPFPTKKSVSSPNPSRISKSITSSKSSNMFFDFKLQNSGFDFVVFNNTSPTTFKRRYVRRKPHTKSKNSSSPCALSSESSCSTVPSSSTSTHEMRPIQAVPPALHTAGCGQSVCRFEDHQEISSNGQPNLLFMTSRSGGQTSSKQHRRTSISIAELLN